MLRSRPPIKPSKSSRYLAHVWTLSWVILGNLLTKGLRSFPLHSDSKVPSSILSDPHSGDDYLFCWACAFHQDKASSVKVPVANVTLFSSAHLLRENTDSFPVFTAGVPVRLLALAMVAVVRNKSSYDLILPTVLKELVLPVQRVSTGNTKQFAKNQHTRAQLVHEDLEQIHDDDLEEMDLKWNMARAKHRGFKQPEVNEYGPRDSSLKPTTICDRESNNSKENTDDSLTQQPKTVTETRMGLLRTELEKIKEEKEGFEFKISKFEKSAKDLDQLLASQITHKSKKGFGYNVVPSSHPLILNRPTPLDLSYLGLEEFKQPEVNEYGPRDSSVKPTTDCDKKSDNSKENTDDSLKQQQKTDSSSVKSPLVVDKDWKEKFFCPANQVREEEPKKARENNDAPIIEDWVSDDEDDVEPIPKVEKKTVIPTATKKEFVKPETPVRRSVRQNVNTVRARGFNVVKPSACWVWKPIKPNGASLSNSQLNDKGFVDSGCSRHMSGNIAHLSDFKDFDGGYVTFGGGANGGRITGKGTIKTDKLDFDDVYFVKELKFNLFSVSQMCDKKNYVLFTDWVPKEKTTS
ncbi:hypothetical protein Tco_0843374 [Tanacetum coccineum]|uniref:Retrovirus-related Pol polyprotein from transposon TNT 1-94-like beta-barrel domain-containing protein n=1 Tax=Tanacetum coccineum TaxID=301880 RepID=A0ABQ5B447_9ASTR